MYSRSVALLGLLASVSAFAPSPAFRPTTLIFADPNPAPRTGAEALEKGWSLGGKAHTKDPTPVVSDDPRKTIPKGESFEEYMKSRRGGASSSYVAPAAPAYTAPAAPAAPAYTAPAAPATPAAPARMMYNTMPLRSNPAPAVPPVVSSTAPKAVSSPSPSGGGSMFSSYMSSRGAAAPSAPSAVGGYDPNPAPKDSAEALEKGWSLGGKAHTKDPAPVVSDDPRKTIPKGESFEEYMKSRR